MINEKRLESPNAKNISLFLLQSEGDNINSLFEKIYSGSSPEIQRAMNKSFTESGGTVLSTNWNEVKEKKVDMKPPDGTEFREWEK